MVDRQYELMRRPRMIDETMNGAKNSVRPDDNEMQTETVQQPAPNQATEAQISEHEVEVNKTF